MKNLSIEEMSAEIQTLREFLDCLTQGLLSDSEVCERLAALVIEAKPFPTNPQCFLWTMFEWDDAPADNDAFVEFAVLPTYIATCILTYAYQKYTIASAVPDFMKTMVGAMNSCVKCGYGGHGYDSDVAFLEHMKYFAQARIDLFISHFPSFHSEFTNSIRAAFRHLENMASGRIVNVWTGKTYAEQADSLLERFEAYNKRIRVFVYGTLMKGERAAGLLEGAEYLGNYILHNYAMIDLGEYPSIFKSKGHSVIGEVYSIPINWLPRLDEYECIGTLYHRQKVIVACETKEISAFVYCSAKEQHGDISSEPWNKKDSDYVWYAAYGSNLSEERFKYYIQGGEYNGKVYDGCRNKSPWVDSTWRVFPGERYYAKSSSRWNGGGVAFFDPHGKGETKMRLYKIQRSQLHDIQEQEGSSKEWYGQLVCLDVLNDGCQVYTFTSEHRQTETQPDADYLKLIETELKKG